MKAIETRYKGYRFRSRLEARWAVFFDVLGVTWEYEPEGFELGGGARYLPDFRTTVEFDLWRVVSWVEIKPTAPNADDIAKLAAVCRAQKANGTFLYGTPGEHGVVLVPAAGGEVRDCGIDERSRRLDCEAWAWRGFPSGRRENYVLTTGAVDAARSARFEFGESGARA